MPFLGSSSPFVIVPFSPPWIFSLPSWVANRLPEQPCCGLGCSSKPLPHSPTPSWWHVLVSMALSTGDPAGTTQHTGSSQPGVGEGSAPASYSKSAHNLTLWGKWIVWMSQVSCRPHKYHVASPERDDQRRSSCLALGHAMGSLCSRLPPWSGGQCSAECSASKSNSSQVKDLARWGVSLTARRGWHKLEGFKSSQQAGPLPEEHRAPELSRLLGAGVGEHSKVTTGHGTGCALMPRCPELWHGQSQGARAVLHHSPWRVVLQPGNC